MRKSGRGKEHGRAPRDLGHEDVGRRAAAVRSGAPVGLRLTMEAIGAGCTAPIAGVPGDLPGSLEPPLGQACFYRPRVARGGRLPHGRRLSQVPPQRRLE